MDGYYTNSLSGYAKKHIEEQLYQNDLKPNKELTKKNFKETSTETFKFNKLKIKIRNIK